MTTWTLLLIFAVGYNSSTAVSINGIKSLTECRRVYQTIISGSIGHEHRFGRVVSQCVEVLK